MRIERSQPRSGERKFKRGKQEERSPFVEVRLATQSLDPDCRGLTIATNIATNPYGLMDGANEYRDHQPGTCVVVMMISESPMATVKNCRMLGDRR